MPSTRSRRTGRRAAEKEAGWEAAQLEEPRISPLSSDEQMEGTHYQTPPTLPPTVLPPPAAYPTPCARVHELVAQLEEALQQNPSPNTAPHLQVRHLQRQVQELQLQQVGLPPLGSSPAPTTSTEREEHRRLLEEL